MNIALWIVAGVFAYIVGGFFKLTMPFEKYAGELPAI